MYGQRLEFLINMMDKKAVKHLPQDLQDAINSFIKQTKIIDEYNLESMPSEYTRHIYIDIYERTHTDTRLPYIHS